MVEFTGNSGNILPQIMLLAAWGSKERETEGERDGGREKKEQARIVWVCVWGGGGGRP